MGKINSNSRRSKIRIKKKKQEKLKDLKEKYKKTSKKQEKEEIVKKMQVMAPYLRIEEYLK